MMQETMMGQGQISPIETIDARQNPFDRNKKSILLLVICVIVVAGSIYLISNNKHRPNILTDEERQAIIERIQKQPQGTITQAESDSIIESIKKETATTPPLTDEERSKLIERIKVN